MTKTRNKQDHVRRGNFIRTLRNIHGWLGLWGAVLGLLFGVSGFLLNHRAVLKIPAAQMEASEIQLPVSQPTPATAEEFTRFVQQALAIDQAPVKPKPRKPESSGAETAGKPGEARFLGKEVVQPER